MSDASSNVVDDKELLIATQAIVLALASPIMTSRPVTQSLIYEVEDVVNAEIMEKLAERFPGKRLPRMVVSTYIDPMVPALIKFRPRILPDGV